MKSSHREKAKHLKDAIKYSMSVGEGLLPHGVLSAVVPESEYAAITGERAPARQPKLPTRPQDDSGRARDLYQDELNEYKAWMKGTRQVYDFLIKPFGSNEAMIDMLKPANDKRHGALIPLQTVFERYKAVFLVPMHAELQREVKMLEALRYSPSGSESIEEFLIKYRERLVYLEQHNVQIAPFTIASNLTIAFGGPEGRYKRGIEKFYDEDLENQTPDKLAEEILKDGIRLRNTEAQAMGFAAAVAEAAPATTLQAAMTPELQQQMTDEIAAQVQTALAALIGSQAVVAAAIAAQKTPAPRPARGGTAGKGAAAGGAAVDLNAPIPVMRYCWSCGMNKEHDGSACPHPEKGHKPQATQANPQGGRRRFCSVANRVRFPHP